MCSEIRHFHCAAISIMIKLDCKCLGRGVSAIGDDTQKEAHRKKQPGVCSFQDCVSRIIEPTIRGGGVDGREQNTVWHKRMGAGKTVYLLMLL